MDPTPPHTLDELMTRAYALAGQSIGDIALRLKQRVPDNLTRSKGFIGQLLEMALGADAKQLDQPDFLALGIELKTCPIDHNGKVRESTFICSAPLPFTEKHFSESRLYRKMASMLWCPIIMQPKQPLAERRLATPFLWSPEPHCLQILQQDWEELTTILKLGQFDRLSAHQGQYLQIRPKAPNAKTFVQVIADTGEKISTVPKGFYARSLFTQMILQEQYLLPA